jgi:prepilin peptidase CpaA
VACAGLAAIVDLRTRRIPNLLTFPAVALGILLAMSGAAGQSLGSALLGLGVGAGLMLPGYFWGGTGAGDVKLMGAVGSLLGPGLAMRAFLASAIAGGALALAVAVRRGRLRSAICGAAGLAIGTPRAECAGADVDARRFAYGPAIAIGTAVALVWF